MIYVDSLVAYGAVFVMYSLPSLEVSLLMNYDHLKILFFGKTIWLYMDDMYFILFEFNDYEYSVINLVYYDDIILL